jgi:hypothetical protein
MTRRATPPPFVTRSVTAIMAIAAVLAMGH